MFFFLLLLLFRPRHIDIQSLWVTTWCGSEHHHQHRQSLARQCPASGQLRGRGCVAGGTDARPSATLSLSLSTPTPTRQPPPTLTLPLLLSPASGRRRGDSGSGGGGGSGGGAQHRQHFQITCGSQSSHRLIANTPSDGTVPYDYFMLR